MFVSSIGFELQSVLHPCDLRPGDTLGHANKADLSSQMVPLHKMRRLDDTSTLQDDRYTFLTTERTELGTIYC